MLESLTTLGTRGEFLFFRAIFPFSNPTAMRQTLRSVSISRNALASGSGG